MAPRRLNGLHPERYNSTEAKIFKITTLIRYVLDDFDNMIYDFSINIFWF
jgi:hypothetical protein